MRVTSLGYRTDVALRMLEGAEVAARGDHLVVRTPGNPDYWWGNFLLLAAWPRPDTGDSWLARFAAEFPAARHVALGVDAAAGLEVVPVEFVAARLEARRDTVLTCAAVKPPPHHSAAAAIRRLHPDDDADWRQSVDLSVRCHDQGDAGGYLERKTTARRRVVRAGRGAWFGAFRGGRLLAQLGLFDAGGGYARYQHVETDPEFRRQGLAGSLLGHAGRYGRDELGASTLVIVADPADAAILLYRARGFADREIQVSFERPADD